VTSAIVVLAAGEGARVGAGRNKVLLPLAGEPILSHSLRTARSVSGVGRILLVVREGDPAVTEGVETVTGGPTRHDSEWHALQVLADDIDSGLIDVVAIHDAARPLASRALFENVIAAAREVGGAIPGRPQQGLIHRDTHAPASDLVAVQTPQAFAAAPLLAAYRAAAAEGFRGTDTAASLERFTDLSIAWVPAPATNLKVTFPEDVALAEALLRGED
jgi:2-C-methyl-D-erythritol 4-phosphate cytidylyltransferase